MQEDTTSYIPSILAYNQCLSSQLIVFYLFQLRVLTAEISTEKDKPFVNDSSSSSSTRINLLGAKRNTQEYELEKPTVDNLGRYTQESLVFSFVLFNIFGKLFGGELPEST